jgi:hypothetical protein
MSKAIKSPKNSDPLITGAKQHFDAAAAALRTGCAEALITGLHLIALHARSNAGQGGDRRSRSAESGFAAELQEIGIAESTARRWMHACHNALIRSCLVMDGEDLLGELPEHGMPRWETWEQGLRKVADGMSLSRLMLGQVRDCTEDHRYEVLLSGSEDGSPNATALLLGVADGRYTLAQAVKALGSQDAYDKLRAEGGDKIRKDPVYLAFDGIEKKAVGLIPKAFTTLHNGFLQWDTYDPDARAEMRRHWIEVIKSTPKELTELLRK